MERGKKQRVSSKKAPVSAKAVGGVRCYSEEEVRELLYREFLVWMTGQTYTSEGGGAPMYYEHDVRKFVGSVHRLAARFTGVID